MIATFDNSAVDSYMNEQIKRESEKTRTQALKNDKSHAINQGLKWSLISLGLGIAIFIGLSGIGNALSFKQVKENITSTFSENSNSGVPSKEGLVGDDVLLDVDALLEEASNFPNVEDPEITESVRNYVIFDKFEINLGNVTTLWVGRNYPDPDSPSDNQWCYVDIRSSTEADINFYFIKVNAGARTENEINEDALSILGLTYDQAINLRNKCGI
tara:strand:- start:933 stop:1577 length:645 start_codon:yes stop_codon:yes gene_type:complete